jgi:hypothetical protein
MSAYEGRRAIARRLHEHQRLLQQVLTDLRGRLTPAGEAGRN